MASIDQLKAWFERDLRFATWDENVLVDDTDPRKIEIRFYTDVNEYVLSLPAEGATGTVEATVRPRKARAGQEAPRVRHLLAAAGNSLTERVWRRILGSIVGLELVRVHRREAGERTVAPFERERRDEVYPGRTYASTAGR